ncbi:MAG: hypothetical protein ABIE70_06920 [bacterium]
MIRSAQIALVIVALAASFAAASDVTNVQLAYKNGQTIATIESTGEARFTHQIEDAKDGKPFRVIVDILSATHGLKSKNFTSVPACIVSGIRSSQFSVYPEKVVRVVFDMDRETVYQIAGQGNRIQVTFPDKNAAAFTEWNSREAVAKTFAVASDKGRGFVAPQSKHETLPTGKAESTPKTAKQYNDAYDKDRLVSLENEPAPKSSVNKPAAKPPTVAGTPPVEKVVKAKSDPAAPAKFSDKDKLANLYQPTPAPKPAEKAPVRPAEVKQLAVNPETPSKPVASKTPAVKEPVKKTALATKPVAQPQPRITKDVNTKAAPSTPLVLAATDPEPTSKAPTVKKVNQTPVKATAQEAEDKTAPDTEMEPSKSTKPTPQKVDRKATSRFRRDPVMSKKMKGTLVAEFPKRLVVKYKTQGRDPFATLINEAAVNHNQMEQRIPNVDGLRMVGVIEAQGGVNSALFEDSDGYGYILKAGDKVRRGYVLRVEKDRVYFQIFEYGWSRTVALNLE